MVRPWCARVPSVAGRAVAGEAGSHGAGAAARVPRGHPGRGKRPQAARLRRSSLNAPTTGRPMPNMASVAGSGDAAATGTLVVVMLCSVLPSISRCVAEVKSESAGEPYFETIEKLPNPVWPEIGVAPSNV